MHILIEKDANTKIPKEVADLDAARAYAAQGFHVSIIEDGVARPLEAEVVPEPEVEVTDLTDGAEITAAGVTPLPTIEG